jgi:hypothetical protein
VFNHAFRSPPATRLFCIAALTLTLGAFPATGSATAGDNAAQATAQAQRAQARAERELQRETRKLQRQAARQAQRSRRAAERGERRAARAAEREERRAMRAAERAERSGAAGDSAAAPAQNDATTPGAKTEAPSTAREAPPGPGVHGPCTLTAEASSQQVASGETVTISGKLSCPTTADAGGQEVTVSQLGSVAAKSGLNVAGTATTEADGSYKLHSAELKGRSVFVVRTPSAQHAARVAVTAAGVVSLQSPEAAGASLQMGANGPARATFTGAVQPGEAGRLVALKVRYGAGEWRTVAFARTDAEGHFKFSHRFRFAGQVSVIAASSPRGMARTQSQPLAYTVVQAQNPAITIATAAPPLSSSEGLASGEPITITGVVVGSPHQAVTLLSRAPGTGFFTDVQTVQSDGAGAYSFTVVPTQTTIYAVRSGKSRSTEVRREVS